MLTSFFKKIKYLPVAGDEYGDKSRSEESLRPPRRLWLRAQVALPWCLTLIFAWLSLMLALERFNGYHYEASELGTFAAGFATDFSTSRHNYP